MESMKTITLKSSDGEVFEIPADVAAVSETIKNVIGDRCDYDVIPLPAISGMILSKVIDYCKRHVRSGPGNIAEDGKKLMEWDAKFIDVDTPILLDLTRAANYLYIPGLLDLTCQAVADLITRSTPQEIRKALNIKDDFTIDDLEDLFKTAHRWLE